MLPWFPVLFNARKALFLLLLVNTEVESDELILGVVSTVCFICFHMKTLRELCRLGPAPEPQWKVKQFWSQTSIWSLAMHPGMGLHMYYFFNFTSILSRLAAARSLWWPSTHLVRWKMAGDVSLFMYNLELFIIGVYSPLNLKVAAIMLAKQSLKILLTCTFWVLGVYSKNLRRFWFSWYIDQIWVSRSTGCPVDQVN